MIAIALAAADELEDVPSEISFILMSWDVVKVLDETRSDLIIVLESTSLKPNLAKSSMLPLFPLSVFYI